MKSIGKIIEYQNYDLFRILILFLSKTALFLLLLISPVFVRAQSAGDNSGASAEGKIMDEKKAALGGVTVTIYRAADSALIKGASSDNAGHYLITELKPGRYYALASFIGFNKTRTKIFDLAQGQHLTLPQLQLSESAKSLAGVTVTAKKPFIERQVDKTVLNIESDVIASGGTALEALKRAPGVTVDKDDNIQLRGKAGVSVMIDGKLTYMSTAQVTTMLKNMPASSISQIEVITQPSAKYDAAGNVGIINIRTKKIKKAGLNGLVSLGYGYGKFSKYNGSLNLNFQKDRFNFFGNYDYSDNMNYNNLDLIRQVPLNNIISVFNQHGYFVNHYFNNNYKAGVDYSISKNHTVGILVSGYAGHGQTNTTSQTTIYNMATPGVVDSTLQSLASNPASYVSTDYNLNYRGTLDTSGTELSADFDYSKFNNQNHASYSNAFYLPNQTIPFEGPYITHNYSPSLISIRVGKIDFSHPFNKTSKMEAGLKYSSVTTNNTVSYDSVLNGVTVPSLSLNDKFIYTEKVAAAYVSFNKKIKGLGIQLGLRVEHTSSDGNSLTTNEDIRRSYTDLFPNIALSQTLDKNHQLSASYTRRIDRPSYQDLNPFRFNIDQYTSQKGNPFLNPQYTDAFELSHTYKQSTILSLNFSHTRDVATQAILQNDTTKKIEQTTLNLADLYSYGLTFSTPIVFASWWTLNPNFNANYNRYTAPANSPAGQLSAGKIAYNLNVTSSFTLPKEWTIELQGYYNSSFIYAYLHGKPQYAISGGIQKNFWSKKANLKLNVNDIFNLSHFSGSQNSQGLNLLIQNHWESRRASLTFTYRFGSTSVGAKTHKETGSDDAEKNRVKSGH